MDGRAELKLARTTTRVCIGVVVVLALIVTACSSESPPPSAAPVKQEGGGAVTGLMDDPVTFIGEGLATGVLSGIGGKGFNWVLTLVGKGDKTPEQLQYIREKVDSLNADVKILKEQVDGLRQDTKDAFVQMSGKVDEASLTNARSTIDTANVDLQNFNDLAAKGQVSDDFVKAYGVTASNPLSKSLVAIDNVLRNGGATGQPLITTAHQIFASKPQVAFDDRELRARLGLPRGATQKQVDDACAKPANSATCKGSSYYDYMAGVLNYYIAYQIRALSALVVGLYANGSPAARATAASMVTMVWNNIREQVLLGGAPISDKDAALENGGAPRYDSANLLWQRQPTTSVSLTRPEPAPFAADAPMDCTPNDFPDRAQCRLNDTPFHVETSEASEGVPPTPLCLLEGKRGSIQYAAFKPANGIYEATAPDLQGCQGTTTGLRVPTRAELTAATAKNPQNYDALRFRSPAPTPDERFLTYTPAQISCGYDLPGNAPKERYTNVKNDSTINGLADTWSKNGWSKTSQFGFYNWRNHAQQGPDQPCIQYQVPFYGDTNGILASGMNLCLAYSLVQHDQCFGRANYTGKNIGAESNTSVWGVRSVVRCDADVENAQGRKPGPHDTNSCTKDPAPGRWELPRCTTASGRWTLCGDKWVDELWKPLATLVPPATVTDCSTWSANGTVCSAGDGPGGAVKVIDDTNDHSVRVESSAGGEVTVSVASSTALPCLTAGNCADSGGATIRTFRLRAPAGSDASPVTVSSIVAGTAANVAPPPDDAPGTTGTTAPAVTITELPATTCTAVQSGVCEWKDAPA